MAINKYINIKTKYGSFVVLLRPNHPDKGYTVVVPKLKGIVTHGDTLQKAKEMALEAIELHCEGLLEEGLAEVRILPKKRMNSNIKSPIKTGILVIV